MIDKTKIAILSTVINFELYSKSSLLFPNVDKYVIDGRSGMYGIESLCYMMEKLGNKEIDWLIMADEDVLFQNAESVYELIEDMQKNNFMFCGVRDGGAIAHRNNNPYVINTFFSILNFKELKQIWNKKEMLSNQFIGADEFMDDISELPFVYHKESLYEPYYCFYLWLRRLGKKALFLNAEMPFSDDSITNSVLTNSRETILFHTWYARSYGTNDKHTKRIDTIFNKMNLEVLNSKTPVIFKDATFAFRKFIKYQIKRIQNKIFKKKI